MFFMELFGKMELNTYLCRAKKERDGLRHQRYITQTGYRTLPEFAKKETLRIIPQQFQARQHDTVQLTYPHTIYKEVNGKRKKLRVPMLPNFLFSNKSRINIEFIT